MKRRNTDRNAIESFMQGKLIGMHEALRDISDLVEPKETKRIETEEHYRKLVQDSTDGMVIWDRHEVLFANKALLGIFGCRKKKEMIGRPLTDFISREYRESILAGEGEREIALPRRYEFGARRLDGTRFVAELSQSRIQYKGKTAWQGIVMDITERKQAQETLRQSEAKYRGLTEKSLIGVSIVQDEKFVFVNPRFAEMHGYRTRELTGKSVFALITVENREITRQRMTEILEGRLRSKRLEAERIRKNGTTFWCELISAPTEYKGRPAIVAQCIDITGRKEAEKALQKAHQLLEKRVQERTAKLEEVNTALRVLIKRGEQQKAEMEEKVLLNVKELITPYVEKLKKGPLTETQKNHMEILESNLEDIISAFPRKLSARYMNITRGEMQVANLVKEGKKTKEIAQILNSTQRAVQSHRENLRKKLGLRKHKTNLRTYLISFQ